MLLSRDAILAASDIETEDVAVPEWGGSVRVRGMSGKERSEFELSLQEPLKQSKGAERRYGPKTQTNIRTIREKLCMWCIVDAHGQRLFSDDDLGAIADKSAAALERVVDAAMRLSGMNEEDVEQMAEEMLESPFVASSSDSPENSE